MLHYIAVSWIRRFPEMIQHTRRHGLLRPVLLASIILAPAVAAQNPPAANVGATAHVDAIVAGGSGLKCCTASNPNSMASCR